MLVRLLRIANPRSDRGYAWRNPLWGWNSIPSWFPWGNWNKLLRRRSAWKLEQIITKTLRVGSFFATLGFGTESLWDSGEMTHRT